MPKAKPSVDDWIRGHSELRYENCKINLSSVPQNGKVFGLDLKIILPMYYFVDQL
jgi:hypothetical protein